MTGRISSWRRTTLIPADQSGIAVYLATQTRIYLATYILSRSDAQLTDLQEVYKNVSYESPL